MSRLSRLGMLQRPTISRRIMLTVLAITGIFSIAVIMRSFAAKYGFYLNEFDPYYDYRAANFIVNAFDQSWKAGTGGFEGLLSYFSWIDYSTWFPVGRQVASTSQDGLQMAGALLYIFFRNVLGLQMSLYDFLVLLPVFLGALTAVVFYFLVKRIAGDAGGLFAALMIAVSPPLIERGNLGWFKSEPLAILLFGVASYLLLTLIDSDMSLRQRVFRAVFAGLLIGYANTSWGGALYFSAALGLFFVLLPFLNIDMSAMAITGLLMTAGDLFASAIFPRPGVEIVSSPEGIVLIGGTVFLVIAQWMRSWVRPAEYRRTLVKVTIGFAFAGIGVLGFGLASSLSARYLSVIFPWVRSNNALVQSVAEQAIPTGSDYFSSYLLLLFLGVFGTITAFRRKTPATIFTLVISFLLLYASAAFSRLLVYSSIALIILAGIGFAELTFSLAKPGASNALVRRKPVYNTKNEMRTFYSVAFIALLALPVGIYWIPNSVQCSGTNTFICDQSPADSGVSLTNGGTVFSRSSLTDWPQALQWISDNTPQNAVIIAWWDYGYWITVNGNRTTVEDNATLNETRIAEVGQMFMSNATVAAKMAEQMAHGRPVYVLTFLTGSLVQLPNTQQQYYILQVPSGSGFTPGGGDESKKQWFIRIAGLDETKFLQPQPDDFNLTPYALQNTIFGQMLPFTSAGYYDLASQSVTPTWSLDSNGNPPLQIFNSPPSFQFSATSTPFRIVFYSSSLNNPTQCAQGAECFSTVFIYQVVTNSTK